MTTVLIVEDEADLADVLAALLESRGYRVLLAYNGREGLARSLEERPDVVVTDMMMPLMDGQEMIRKMRENPAMCDVPVIVVSAVDRSRGDNPHFLRKPFELQELIGLLEQVTGGSD